VAILVADGFEQAELTEPRKALDAAGADTSIVSLKPGRARATGFPRHRASISPRGVAAFRSRD
jgi:putative intracellular protease/amidase